MTEPFKIGERLELDNGVIVYVERVEPDGRVFVLCMDGFVRELKTPLTK